MRRRRLIVCLRALDDLLRIHNCIAEFNPAAARLLLDDLNDKMVWLAKNRRNRHA